MLTVNTVKFFAVGAAAMLSACVSYEPEESIVGDYLSARMAARANDAGSAADAYGDAFSVVPASVDILRDAFFYSLVAGDIDEAMGYAAQLSKREDAGDDGLSVLALAARAIKQGDYAGVEKLLDDHTIAGYLTPTANIIRAWAIDGRKGPEAALASLRETAGNEYKGFYPIHQALLSDKAGDIEEARSAYQMSVMANGGAVEVASYGAFLERQKEESEAREFYGLLADKPGFARIPAEAGIARLDEGRAAPSVTSQTPAIGAAKAYFSLANGVLQQTVNQRVAAEEAGFRVPNANYNMPLAMTQLALYLDPGFDDARRLAGSIFNVYGKNENAIAVLSKIAPSSPYYAQSQIDIAGALNALERNEEAISVLKDVARRSGSTDARLALAGMYSSEERHEEAVATLTGLIAESENSPSTEDWRNYLARAASLLLLDEWPRAEADLKKAVELAPEEPAALNYLGYSWVERGENLEEAFTLIEKAVSLQPDSGAIIDSLGWAHYQQGNYQEAVNNLEHAASLEPGDPTVVDHLGDVYWRLGRKIEAQYQWRHVLELDPNDKLKAAVEEKLQHGLDDGDGSANDH
ncbi:MAG: hypothetical protein DHS20C05_24060 [Hyphococcus sp.]|nr:MAG: hypothetical protein DHS20C05_24060 [Marinicaulis sp.]